MSLTLGVLISLAAAGVLGFLFLRWRRRSGPGRTGIAEAPWLDRITVRLPFLPKFHAGSGEGRTGLRLKGNLAQTPLHDLLQYLSLGRKSGILELTSGRRAGRVVLRNGKVHKNSYRGKDGMDAIFLMLDLAEGDFEFDERAPDEPSSHPLLEVVDIIMIWMDRKQKKSSRPGNRS